MDAPARSLQHLEASVKGVKDVMIRAFTRGIKISKLDLESSIEDFWVTSERTRMAAKWDETIINEWIQKGWTLCGGIIQEATAALERAEAREAEEVGVWLMETTRDKLIDLASKVESQTEEAELGLLIKLGEEIEYRRDNVASNPRILKGNLHEELGERAQIAFDESVDAAKVWQQKLNAIRARLDFHSVNSEASSYVGRQPARDREVAPAGRPPRQHCGTARRGLPFQVRASRRSSYRRWSGGVG
jgi:hypothetical protein